MSKKLKLSPWHDGSVKPVHKGVYEVEWSWNNSDYEGGTWFNFWINGKFCIGMPDVIRASNRRTRLPATMKPIRWRGVLK